MQDSSASLLSLESVCRVPVFLGITGKDDAVHWLAGSSIHDLVQRFQEVLYAEGNPVFWILPAVIGHINVGVCKSAVVFAYHSPVKGIWLFSRFPLRNQGSRST